jgi:hypothetical protein
MRAWRRGCGPLEPWFRATPFAAATHYRDRALPVPRVAAPAAAAIRLVAGLPAPARRTLWVLDLPGPLGLWVAWELRRRWGLSAALAWNAWYDPRGILDGREEIPLLCTLARRLRRPSGRGAGAILFDSHRLRTIPESARAHVLDNRYVLNEEDAPSLEQLRAMGIERVRAWSWREAAEDLRAYLDYLGGRLVVLHRAPLAQEVGAHA